MQITHKKNILIIDDSPEIIDNLKNVLLANYRVRPAINGELGLRLAEMIPSPDLILLDIMMPDIDGYEVCQRLKRNVRTQDIPIIFISSKAEIEDEIKGLELGAVDYISKPINPALVLQRIKTHLALQDFNSKLEQKNQELYNINDKLQESMGMLSASEERFRSLVQTIPDIVYKIDLEGNFTFLNRSIERLGYHQSELIGKHFSELIHHVDVPNVSLDKVIERIGKGTDNPSQKVFDERRTGERMTMGLEIRLRTKKGSSEEVFELKNINDEFINVEVNCTGLYGKHSNLTADEIEIQYVGTVGVIRDITERQEAEKKLREERKLLRHLIDAVPTPIFFSAIDGELIYANKALEQFLGIGTLDAKEKYFIQDTFSEIIQHNISKLITNKEKSVIQFELDLKDNEAQIHSMLVNLSEFHGDVSDKSTIVCVMIDNSSHKEFTQLLQQKQLKVEQLALEADQANQAKSDFLANMSHEIRTPLNAVVGLSHICLNTELNKKQHNYLSKIVANADSLLELVNDILDFSKIEAGKLVLEHANFSVQKILDRIIASFSDKCQQKGIELLMDIDKNIPEYIIGDGHRFQQILINLISNAVKFTETGQIIARINIKEKDQQTIVLNCSVEDSGIGMSEAQLDKLFTKFSQADASTTRKYGGTGLGLAICKQLLELMGGEIKVESQVDKGSRFFFSINFSLGDISTSIIKAGETLPHLRVLLVDDNEQALEILKGLLESMAWDIDCAVNGEQAVATVIDAKQQGNGYDIVFLDWEMPILSGLEVARQIKQQLKEDKQPKLILMSAYHQDELYSKADIKELFDEFLAKPFTLSKLFDAVKNCLGVAVTDNSLKQQQSKLLLGKSVLIVDDSLTNRLVVKEMLKGYQINISEAKDGRQAVEMIKTEHFDAVLMDIQMPNMNGIEATRAVRQQLENEHIPIIAMTVNAMSDDFQKSIAAGMNDHIIKPINFELLHQTLLKWLVTDADNTSENLNKQLKDSLEQLDKDQLDKTQLEQRFTKIMSMLEGYDSDALELIDELDNLINSSTHKQWMLQINNACSQYDFEKCLELFQQWSVEEGFKTNKTKEI